MAAPEAIGYQADAPYDATTVGMIVVADSSSKATRVMSRTEPSARPISIRLHGVGDGGEEAGDMMPILLAATAGLRIASVQWPCRRLSRGWYQRKE